MLKDLKKGGKMYASKTMTKGQSHTIAEMRKVEINTTYEALHWILETFLLEHFLCDHLLRTR